MVGVAILGDERGVNVFLFKLACYCMIFMFYFLFTLDILIIKSELGNQCVS